MRYLTFVAVAALLPALAASLGQAASPDEAQNCAAMTGRHIGGALIEKAAWQPDGGTVGTTQVSQPFCRVIGVITPTSDSHIGFEVWLPPGARWNGNFRGEG